MRNLCTKKRPQKFTNVKCSHCVKRGVSYFGKTNVQIKEDGNRCWCSQCNKIGKNEPPKIEIFCDENVHNMSRDFSYHKITVWSAMMSPWPS